MIILEMDIHNVVIIPKYNSSYAEGVARNTAKLVQKRGSNVYTISPFSVEKGIASIRPYQRNERTIISSPVVTGDLVIFGSTDGYIYLLDRSTMKERQKIYIGAPIASSPAISGNALFIAAYDGNVYAFAAAVPP